MQQCRAGGDENLFLGLSSPVAYSGHIYSMTFCQTQGSRVQTLLLSLQPVKKLGKPLIQRPSSASSCRLPLVEVP